MTVSNNLQKGPLTPWIFLGPWFNICIWDRIRSTKLAVHVPHRDRCEWYEGDNTQGPSPPKHASPCQYRLCQSQRFWIPAQSSSPNPGCKAMIHFAHLCKTHVQVFYMFESDEYPFASNSITRTLHFPQPLVTTKIKLDKMMGASGFVIQVEFVGMDQETKARQFSLPFEGGNVFKSNTKSFVSLNIGPDLFKSETTKFSADHWNEFICKQNLHFSHQDQTGSHSMTTNLAKSMEMIETTGVWLKTSLTLVLIFSAEKSIKNTNTNPGGTQKFHKLVAGDAPTEDYQLPAKTQHDDWRPWQSLADCAKKCRSTTNCTGVTLKTRSEKGKCEMVKEGWPQSDQIVTDASNAEHSAINREYCESLQYCNHLSYACF